MAKFCGNCGAQLDDGDKVCGQCGTPVNGNAGTVPGLKVVDPEKKKVIVYDFEQENGKEDKGDSCTCNSSSFSYYRSEGLSQLHGHKWSCPQGYDSL